MSVKPLSETTDPDSDPGLDAGDLYGDGDISWALGHAEWLRRLIARRIKPLDCGEEVLQEVWLAASRSTAIPADPEEHTPWLARVAIRQCALALRGWARRQRRESVYAERQQREIEAAQADPLFALLADEQRQMVREQVEHLPELHRDLLRMKYVNGWSYREIARRLGMDLTAVEYQLSKARKGLRGRLTRAGFEEAQRGVARQGDAGNSGGRENE